MFKPWNIPIIKSTSDNLELIKMSIIETEYRIISRAYENKTTKRSQRPLIAHIDEGLKILAKLGASDYEKAAYCLHPIVQQDSEMYSFYESKDILTIHPRVILLATEYRNVANRALSSHNITNSNQISLSPIYEVNRMLIADKIQNRKDFEIYHKSTHERSAELDLYFRLWLERLGIDENSYQYFVKILSS